MTHSTPRLLLGDHSDPGPRVGNQDTVLTVKLPDGRWVAAVADGMGGLEDGEQAGKLALAIFYKNLRDGASLSRAVQEANAAVFRESQGCATTGTTLVAAVLEGERVEIVNVGDSRAYHLDSLGLLQVSRDHTMWEEAIRTGAFLVSTVPPNPWTSALARYVGAGESVEAEVFGPLILKPGSWLLLCSDGLYKVLPDDEMEELLKGASDPGRAARKLVEVALERKTPDNVSVVLVYRPGEGENAVLRGESEKDFEPGGGSEVVPPPLTHVAGVAAPIPNPVVVRREEAPAIQVRAGPSRLRPSVRGTVKTESLWNPDTIFTRSSRYRPQRRAVALAGVVIVGLTALLIAAIVAVARIIFQ